MAEYDPNREVELHTALAEDGPAVFVRMHLSTACAISSLRQRVLASPAMGVLAARDAEDIADLCEEIDKHQREHLLRVGRQMHAKTAARKEAQQCPTSSL